MIWHKNKTENFDKKVGLNQGFSLIETLVAITILLIVIVGPMAISSSTARSTSFASEEVTAFFLAQEGVEMVQAYRDDLFLEYIDGTENDPWGVFTSQTGWIRDCYESDGCALEMGSGGLNAPQDCTSLGTDCLMHIDTATADKRSRFTYNAAYTATPYKRKMYLTYDNTNPQEVLVRSEVTWRSGNLRDEQSVVVETYLLNTYATN